MPTTLRVEDMSCDGCEDIVETALEEVTGVESVTADEETGTAVVDGDAAVDDLVDAVDHAGYAAELDPAAETETVEDEVEAEEPTESAE